MESDFRLAITYITYALGVLVLQTHMRKWLGLEIDDVVIVVKYWHFMLLSMCVSLFCLVRSASHLWRLVRGTNEV